MKSFKVFEMTYTGKKIPKTDIIPIPFEDRYYSEYERIYNECFFDMRKALDIEPYSFYSDISQLEAKKNNIFLLIIEEVLIGSIACYDIEIDDLIVNPDYQGRGYGKALLNWAISHIIAYSAEPITLHVAEWNQKAIKLYLQIGFEITKTEIIERDK